MICPLYTLYIYVPLYISMISKYLYDFNYCIDIYKYMVFYKYIYIYIYIYIYYSYTLFI